MCLPAPAPCKVTRLCSADEAQHSMNCQRRNICKAWTQHNKTKFDFYRQKKKKKNLGRAGSNIQHFASFTNASLLESH